MSDVRGDRMVRLIRDPDLGGDLLLLAVGLSAVYDFGLTYDNGIHGIGDMLWAGSPRSTTYAYAHGHIRQVFKSDMRTYKPPTGYSPTSCVRKCTAPMIRRDTCCGRAATTWGHVTDWSTGDQNYIGACGRHYSWFDAEKRADRSTRPDVVPLPYANHGGLLARHFPRVDWPRFWRDLDPKWVEHPERMTLPKPDLSLVIGNGEGGSAASPLLSLVPIGGAS